MSARRLEYAMNAGGGTNPVALAATVRWPRSAPAFSLRPSLRLIEFRLATRHVLE